MRERLQSPMALWRLQYHLLGGNTRLLGSVMIYGTVLIAGAYGFRRLMWRETLDSAAGTMLNALAAIQIFIAVMGGCNAIYRANLRDFESKMVESHRLTPMSNISVVLGYLFGATLQMQVLFFVGFAVGAVLTALAKLPVADWVAGNFFILNGAMTLWAASLVSGLRLVKPLSPAGFLIGAGVLGNVGIFLLPAAGILFAAYPILFGFQIVTGSNALSIEAIIMIAALSAVMTMYWLSTAAAKYRRPDLPALNAVRGLMLLAFWVITGTAGMVVYFSSLVGPNVAPKGEEIMLIQWVATLGLSLLVALPAIGGSVECGRLIRKGTSARGWGDRVPSWLVCLLAAAVIMLPTVLIGSQIAEELLPTALQTGDGSVVELPIDDEVIPQTMAWGFTAIAILLALFTAREVHISAYAIHRRPRFLATALLIFMWAVPPVADLIRGEIAQASMDSYATAQFTGLFGCSPVGTIMGTWASELEVPIAWGLVAQAFMLTLLALASNQLTRKERA